MKFRNPSIDYSFLFLYITCVSSWVIPSVTENEPLPPNDFKCTFNNSNTTEFYSISFHRSPYNCRVYHICAFGKQFSYICAEGLFFDDRLETCNFEHEVECNEISAPTVTQPNESIKKMDEPKLALVSSTPCPLITTEPQTTSTTTTISITTTTMVSTSPSTKSLLFSLNKIETTTTSTLTYPSTSVEISTTTEANSNEIKFQKSTLMGGSPKSTRDEPISTESYTSSTTATNPTSTTTTLEVTTTTTSLPTTTTEFRNIWWQIPDECVSGFDHKIPSPLNCAFYFECTKDGRKSLKSCPYPLLYDEMFSECRPYELVDCGKRKQAKDLCDYQLPSNETGEISVEECELYPSCRNLSDGLYPTHDCRHYFQCKDERTLRIYSCPRNATTGAYLKFNYLTKRCDYIENVSFNCGGYAIPIDIYTNNMVCPSQSSLRSSSSYAAYSSSGNSRTLVETKDLYFSHPRDCSVYIGCDEFGNMSVLECLNGTHFSPYYQSCVHASIAQCKKYPTIDQTPINISLRLLIMNNSLKNFDLELFNNSNETILEESFLGALDSDAVTASTTTASSRESDEMEDEATVLIQTRNLAKNATLSLLNGTNSTSL